MISRVHDGRYLGQMRHDKNGRIKIGMRMTESYPSTFTFLLQIATPRLETRCDPSTGSSVVIFQSMQKHRRLPPSLSGGASVLSSDLLSTRCPKVKEPKYFISGQATTGSGSALFGK